MPLLFLYQSENQTIRTMPMKGLLAQLKQIPFPTIVGVIAVCVAVFLVEEAGGLDFSRDYGARPAEFQPVWQNLKQGQITTAGLLVLTKLVTPLFLHGGPDHIRANMVFLWAFGTLVAGLLGD